MGDATFVKGEKNKNITDPDILDLVKKYHFKYDGTYFSSDDINVGREFVNMILKQESATFPRALFEYYMRNGVQHYNKDIAVGSVISSSISEMREANLETVIAQENANIAKFVLNNNFGDAPHLSRDPVQRALDWTKYEVAFKYFSHQISKGKLKLVPSLIAETSTQIGIAYFVSEASSEGFSTKDEFNLGFSAVRTFVDAYKNVVDRLAEKNNVVLIKLSKVTNRFESIEIFGEEYYIVNNSAKEQ